MKYYVNNIRNFFFFLEERNVKLFSRKGDYIEGKTERSHFRARRVSLLRSSVFHLLGALFFLILCIPYGLAGFLSLFIVGSFLALCSFTFPRRTAVAVFLGGIFSAIVMVLFLSIPVPAAFSVAVFSTSAFALLEPVLRIYLEGFEVYEILEVRKNEEDSWKRVKGFYLLGKKRR